MVQISSAVLDNTETGINESLPGDIAMWLFILMELTVFAVFFIGFAVTQGLKPEMFTMGKTTLHPIAGLFCTLALITSSYFVALAVAKLKQGAQHQSSKLLGAALFMASLYLVTKFWEYFQLGSAGYGLSSNTFYTLYFFTTFFHLMHVVLGMIILGYMALRARNEAYTDEHDGFEAGACYWHMVDLVWIILFPLFYVIH